MTDPSTAILSQPGPRTRRRGADMLGGPLGWLAAAAFAVVAAIAVFVAAAAAALIAVLGAIALLVLRLSPRRRAPTARVLEGRRTAEGWVVEAASR